MAKYLMQAVSSGVGGDGAIKTWSSPTPDFAATGFPGPGTAAHTAIAKKIKDDVLVTAGDGTSDGDEVRWNGSIWVKERGFIKPAVDYSGAVNARTEIQNRLNGARAGQCVKLEDGKINWGSSAGGITVPEGVTLTGTEIGHHGGPFTFNNTLATGGISGTMVLVTATSGVAITLGQQSRVMNLVGYYPNQHRTNAQWTSGGSTPVVYDYFIQAPANAHNTTIQNVTCINPYRFIRIGQATTPYAANGCLIENVDGYPISTGLVLGRCADVARISNVHFNPGRHFEFESSLKAWVQANGQAHVIDGPEEFVFTGCFVYGYNRGIRFIDADGDGFRGVYGSWFGGGLDICNSCILVEEPNGLTLRGFKIANAGIVPNGAAAYGVLFLDTHTAANADERPAIYASNLSFWNTMSRAVYLVNGSYGIYQQFGGSVRGHTNEGFRVEGANARCHLDGVGVDGGTRSAAASSGVLVDVNTWDP